MKSRRIRTILKFDYNVDVIDDKDGNNDNNGKKSKINKKTNKKVNKKTAKNKFFRV